MPTIRHNDGTAGRVAVGQRVRFEGVLYYDFERGTWVGNYLPEPPPEGKPDDPDRNADFICADLDTLDFPRMARLSGRRVTVIGTAAPQTETDQPCALFLTRVQIRPR
jgi:hypothetical protein